MRTLTVTLLRASSAACAPSPGVRNLGRDPLPPPVAALPDRGCRLALMPVEDLRPEAEREGDALSTVTLLLPLLFYIEWSTEGIEAAAPEHLGGPTLVADVEAGLRTVIERSGTCALVADPALATHTLEIELEHLYGLNGYHRAGWATAAASSETSTEFYPSGHAALSFVLRSGDDSARFRLSGSRLFDPAAPGNDADFDPEGVQPHQVENNRTQQVVATLTSVYERLPLALDRALASLGAEARVPLDETAFVIVRQLDDLEHIEQATIDYASGRVRDVAIVRRVAPLFSAPGEWVVSPYQPAMLTAAAYQRLLEHLSQRYAITWGDNLSAAVFGGLREAPQPVTRAPVDAPSDTRQAPAARKVKARRQVRVAVQR